VVAGGVSGIVHDPREGGDLLALAASGWGGFAVLSSFARRADRRKLRYTTIISML
jgi:hypothetical protein